MKISFVILFLGLVSCDPYYNLIVNNQSDRVRHFSVLGICKDSIVVSKASKTGAANLQIKSTEFSSCNDERSFAFQLQPGQQAVLESGLGPLPQARSIIIDHLDTVKVKKSKGRIAKKPRFVMGGTFTLTTNN